MIDGTKSGKFAPFPRFNTLLTRLITHYPMKVLITSSRKVYLNGQLLSDVVWADPDTGEAELFEHTCSRLHSPERILDLDNAAGYRTLIVRGAVRIEETVPPPAPPSSQPCLDYGDCYVCFMSGLPNCYCGQHVPYPS